MRSASTHIGIRAGFALPVSRHHRCWSNHILRLCFLVCCLMTTISSSVAPHHHRHHRDFNDWASGTSSGSTTAAPATTWISDPPSETIVTATTWMSDPPSETIVTASSSSSSSSHKDQCLLSKALIGLDWNKTTGSYVHNIAVNETAALSSENINNHHRQLRSYEPLPPTDGQGDDMSETDEGLFLSHPPSKIWMRACDCANTETLDDVNNSVIPVHHYCHHSFDACKVRDGEVTCVRYGMAHSFFKSFCWVLVFWFIGLGVVLYVTDLGAAARGFMTRRFRCCYCRCFCRAHNSQDGRQPLSEQDLVQSQLDRLLSRQPERAAHLYRQAREREFTRLQRQMLRQSVTRTESGAEATTLAALSSEQQYPHELGLFNALELKTKVFTGSSDTTDPVSTHSSTTATTEDSPEYESSEEPFSSSSSNTAPPLPRIPVRISSLSTIPSSSSLPLPKDRSEDNDLEEEQEAGVVHCAICLDRIVAGDVIGDLPCQHAFHKECLKGWLLKKNKCPLCQHGNIATPRYLPGDEEAAGDYDDVNLDDDDASTAAQNAWEGR